MSDDAPLAALAIEALEGVSEISATAWDTLVGDAPPVLNHAFLSALEQSECVAPETGWVPRPIVAKDSVSGDVKGLAPAYLKAHSMGEFVYDWAWADAAQRAGLRYYPKMIIASPFSPVAGPRLLRAPGLAKEAAEVVAKGLLKGVEEAARAVGCAGVHMLFCSREEAGLAQSMGYAVRSGMQFHWRNEGYRDFEDFLARFRSKRRNQIRRERRRVVEAGIDTISLSGDEIEAEHMAHAFRFYAATVDQFTWGRRYLTRELFDTLWDTQRAHLQLTLARQRDSGRVLAGTFNFQKGARRYGRYWGTDEHLKMLHFEVCSYAPIADCIERGIEVFEAGAGGGHHKFGRGFLPVETFSAHKLFHPHFHESVRDFCAREAAAVRGEIDALTEALFVR